MRIQDYKLESYNLTAKAVLVFQNLISHMNYRTMECWPSLKKIAAECRLSVSSVQRGLRELLSAGLIRKKSRFRDNRSQTSNLYIIIAHVEERLDAAKENLQILLKQRSEYLAAKVAKQEGRKKQTTMRMPIVKKKVAHAFSNLLKLTSPPIQID